MYPFTRFLVVCSLWCVCVSAAPAREIFVSNVAGDDTFSGRQIMSTSNRSGPVRTIAKALRLAEAGDRIVLANTGQPYRESLSLVGKKNSGSLVQTFVIMGNGAILDGSAPVPPLDWDHYQDHVFRFRPERLQYHQLFLDGKPAQRVIGDRMTDAPPKLKPLQWCLFGEYVYFCVEKNRLPQDYDLTHTDKPVGITLYHVDKLAILEMTVQGFQLDGINLHNSARDIYLGGTTCRGNGRAGITVGGASRVEIDTCLIGNNGLAQLLTLPWSETHVVDTEIVSSTGPAWVDQGGQGRFFYQGERLYNRAESLEPPPAPPEPKAP
ncbi:MAG: right-handed parallel beta-helix repeat-containing protein [Planctomycetes bacterium]|nr:right-handed parallel beta-helix repeat-containing protein [Planctomycetota bacterium]